MGSDVRVHTQRDSHHLGLCSGGNAHELVVASSVPQKGDNILVSHLDVPVAGIHNLGIVARARYEDGRPLLPIGELMVRNTLLVTLVSLLALAPEVNAQRLTQPANQGAQANLNVTGKAGGKKLQASGTGSCRHAPDASIRGVSASLWMVQYGGSGEGPVKQLNLTLWRPKDGSPDQLSLALESKSGQHRIDTGSESANQGEGAVTILPNGPGGRLELKGKDAKGKPIELTIDCPAFAGVEAEGG